MGSRRGAAGANRYLGSRSRAAIQQVQSGGWTPAGMEMFLDGHSKIVTRVENCVQRAVHISFSVVDGRGSRDT